MSRYKKLFDAVSEIVQIYGEGVLSQARFWGLLTDLYPFVNESALREVYKTCIAKGWISNLASFLEDKYLTLDYIRKTVRANPNLNSDELAACLFSIAIAIGRCSEEDYDEFVKDLVSKPSPTITNVSNSSSIQLGSKKGGSYQVVNKPTVNTQHGHSNSGNYQARKNSQKKKSQNRYWWISLAICIFFSLFILAAVKFGRHANNDSNEELKEGSVYVGKVRENEELVKKRRDYRSTLSVKNIELGSEYKVALQKVNANPDFHEGKETDYELKLKGRHHPVWQLMLDDIIYGKNVSKELTEDIVSGKMYSIQTKLDTIRVKLKIFESNGKIMLMMIEGMKGVYSYNKDIGNLMKLYFEKYGLAEKRTFDGLPFDKAKYYAPTNIYSDKYEDLVWTFPKGMIRLGLERIVYADTDFLQMLIKQYEVVEKNRVDQEKAERDSIRKERIRLQREDSIRRIKNHEKAIKDI